MNPLLEATRDFIAVLEALDAHYAIMGNLALCAHAIPQPTYDADFSVALTRDELPRMFAAAEAAGFETPQTYAGGWINTVGGLSVIKLQRRVAGNVIDLDLFLAESPFAREALERRQFLAAEGLEAYFVSPEDLILFKLLAFRLKDRVDIGDILFVQGTLDEIYLREWAERLHISAELETALSERDA